MSVKVQAEIWQFSKQKGTALLLMLAIGDFADDEGMAFPSVETLAMKIRRCERSVQYALARLERSGELVIEHGQGPKGCNLFRVQTLHPVQSSVKRGCNPVPKVGKEKESIKEKEKNTGTINEPSLPPISPRRGFDYFWLIYPRKVGKHAALKSWKRIKPQNDTCATIYAAVEAQKLSEQWQRDNGQFIPHPATWLNQGRWEDEITKPLSLDERAKLGEEHWKTVKANR